MNPRCWQKIDGLCHLAIERERAREAVLMKLPHDLQ
jgi:hypothetical protein